MAKLTTRRGSRYSSRKQRYVTIILCDNYRLSLPACSLRVVRPLTRLITHAAEQRPEITNCSCQIKERAVLDMCLDSRFSCLYQGYLFLSSAPQKQPTTPNETERSHTTTFNCRHSEFRRRASGLDACGQQRTAASLVRLWRCQVITRDT